MVDDFSVFAPTGDVLIYDSYPFSSLADHVPGINDLTKSDKAFKMLMDMRTPWWLCTLAFDQSVTRGKLTDKMPEERELTAIPLLAAIYNAKGFYYYSYHSIFVHDNKHDPKHSEKCGQELYLPENC